jgi:Asp-tRNA(Asn)/Glu-tRNA(Gln) amidotransferase A subunit family amidase
MMTDFQSIRDRHDVILSAEAALVHSEWFQQYEELYSSKFKELIQCGRTVTSSQLSNALSERDDFRAELRRSFLDHNIDLWICPSTIGAAPKGIESTGDPIMNLPWTQAGLPTINLPAGKNQEGLPLGLQLVGNWYKDESLLYWAKDLEKAVSNL